MMTVPGTIITSEDLVLVLRDILYRATADEVRDVRRCIANLGKEAAGDALWTASRTLGLR